MAVSSQDSEAIERKLRPIYDAVDNGQNKKAITQADKVLKKHPNLQRAKALKAVALLRIGRNDDATKTVDEVIDTQPGDSATLQAVYLYCRETGDFNKMVLLYEAAAKKHPSNEEILTHLYMSYVRVDDYQQQQKTATTLLKHFPKNAPYYCWRVMSILMQAYSTTKTEPQKAQTMYLPLAEKLMDKYVSDKRADSEQEVKLYLLVLQDLERHEKILDVIKGDLGKKIRFAEELLSYEVSCLVALKEWGKIVEILTPSIKSSPDNWTLIKEYINAQVNLALELKGNPQDLATQDDASGASPDSDLSSRLPWLAPAYETQELLESLTQDNDEDAIGCRGPFLGQLQLATELKNRNMPNVGAVISMFMKYFEKFSSKNCCYDDIKFYLNLLNELEIQELLSKMSDHVKDCHIDYNCEEKDIKPNVRNLCKHMCLTKLQHYCGVHDNISLDEKLSMVASYQDQFHRGLSLGRLLPSTVNQYSDYYVQQAAHVMFEVYEDTGDVGLLWDCVVMVEKAQRHSSSNPQILLLLLKVYGYLGAVEYCTRIYNSLAIKHIQVDTLGYLTNRYIQAMGAFGFASQMFRMALRFYTTCNKETMDHVTSAYKNGVFNKILEMIKLRDRLHQSLVFYSLGIESFQQDFLNEAVSLKQIKSFFATENFLPFSVENVDEICSSFVDNRDLQVFDVWSPHQMVSEQHTKNSFSLESIWVKFKLTMMQSLKLMLTMDTMMSAETIVSKVAQVKSMLEECKAHDEIENLRKKKCLLLPIQAPPPCQLFLFVSSHFSELLHVSIDIVIKMLSGDEVDQSLYTQACTILEGIATEIKGIPSEIREELNKDDLWTTSSEANNPYEFLLKTKLDLEPYVLLIVVSSWIILMFGVCVEHKLALSHWATSGSRGGGKRKKGKAASATSGQNTAVPMYNENIHALCDVLNDIKKALLFVCEKFQPINRTERWLVEKLSKLTLSNGAQDEDRKVRAEVSGGVLESYNTSFRDCQEIVHNLVAFVNSIVLNCPIKQQSPHKPTSTTSTSSVDKAAITPITNSVDKAAVIDENDEIMKKENLDISNTVK